MLYPPWFCCILAFKNAFSYRGAITKIAAVVDKICDTPLNDSSTDMGKV